MQKVKVEGDSIQKSEWKRTDGRGRVHYLPVLTRSVTNSVKIVRNTRWSGEFALHKRHETMQRQVRRWNILTRSIWKMLGPFATASRFTLSFTRYHYCRHCRTPPAHRCSRRRRRRQRVTEGTSMAPWNRPNNGRIYHLHRLCSIEVDGPRPTCMLLHRAQLSLNSTKAVSSWGSSWHPRRRARRRREHVTRKMLPCGIPAFRDCMCDI